MDTQELEFIKALYKKDPHKLKMIARKVLGEAKDYWAGIANKSMAASTTLSFQDKTADVAEETYNHAFRQWHTIAQMLNNFNAWADSNRKVPEETDEQLQSLRSVRNS